MAGPVVFVDRLRLVAAGRRAVRVSIRRGFIRLGLGLFALWLLFWTCAYILKPQASENAQSLPPALTLPTDLILIAAVILGLPWVVSGFRSD
ncbi:MAG TPA: hypothetical protein VGR45_03985 [Stellaceae bacterium]|nr:hypothetical protein [Stellaceae bacterium]